MLRPKNVFISLVLLINLILFQIVFAGEQAAETTPLKFSPVSNSTDNLVQPEDLIYRGAFRLPDSPTTPDNVNWEWSNWAGAATYYPQGNPAGPSDGYQGSIFGVGHDQTQYVSEVSIPVPKISGTKNVNDLNAAGVLQDFSDIKGGFYSYIEMPRVGLEYLGPQGAQTSGKLYFSWSDHLDEGNTGSTHGWCDLNLANPQSKGIWRIGGRTNYLTADYMFEIPASWANTYTPGYRLATGRYRDGGQDALGPALFTFGPWMDGNPPANGATLATKPLLLYDSILTGLNMQNGYTHTDEWNGGAWLTAGDNSAVIFVGNKGGGYTWYGCQDGRGCVEGVGPGCECEDRGWWSNTIDAQISFYNPADLAMVVQGTLASNRPQPYATMNIDSYLYHISPSATNDKHHISAVAYDRQNSLLYIFEPFADGYKPIVHVFYIKAKIQVGSGKSIVGPTMLLLDNP